MSATGFHPEPSAKAPWTRTIVLTTAYAGDDAARAAPVRRARIKLFMVTLRFIEVDRARTCRQRRPLSDFAHSWRVSIRSVAPEVFHRARRCVEARHLQSRETCCNCRSLQIFGNPF